MLKQTCWRYGGQMVGQIMYSSISKLWPLHMPYPQDEASVLFYMFHCTLLQKSIQIIWPENKLIDTWELWELHDSYTGQQQSFCETKRLKVEQFHLDISWFTYSRHFFNEMKERSESERNRQINLETYLWLQILNTFNETTSLQISLLLT